MILDNLVAQAAPKPEFQVVSGHAFTPPPLPAAVQVEQDVLSLPAGLCTGFHSHGGPAIETVLSGEVVIQTKGTATVMASSQTFKTGEAYIYPTGVVHNFCNMTTLPATWTSAVLVLDGAPVTTPDKESAVPDRSAALATLATNMRRFSFPAGPEDAYQAAHRQLVETLAADGFRTSWARKLSEGGQLVSYDSWYQPDLDMTVLCASQTLGAGHGQTVTMMQGRLRSQDYLPTF
jgi:quercetin dioxygenase-like cupin family protein